MPKHEESFVRLFNYDNLGEFSCDDCHQRAQCVQDDVTREQRCECSTGYYGDGLRCEPVCK